MMKRFQLLVTVLTLLLSTIVNAADKEIPAPVDPLSASSIANMFMGLALVVILIFAMAWVVKRMGGMQLAGSQRLQLLGGLSLGAREKVVLIQVENKRLVVGVAQGQVNTLHVLEGEYENSEKESGNNAADFKDKLLQALNKTINNKTSENKSSNKIVDQ